MKKCFKCNEKKELTEFYKHRKMSDGHLGKCKQCAKSDVIKNRSENIDYYRTYDQMRYQRDEHRRLANKQWWKTEEGQKAKRLCNEKWLSLNPEKRAAQVILRRAVKSGLVNKPDSCTRCDANPPPRLLHGHHDDYTKPLKVEWVCVFCHAAEHFPNEFRYLRT